MQCWHKHRVVNELCFEHTVDECSCVTLTVAFVRCVTCLYGLFTSSLPPQLHVSFLPMCTFVFRSSVCSTGPVKKDRLSCMAASRLRCVPMNKHCLIIQPGSSRSPWWTRWGSLPRFLANFVACFITYKRTKFFFLPASGDPYHYSVPLLPMAV